MEEVLQKIAVVMLLVVVAWMCFGPGDRPRPT